MIIIKSTGLVPVKALKPFNNYLEGDVFGLLPRVAEKAIDDGFAEALPAPEGEEGEDPDAESESASVDTGSSGEVEIPADWEAAHHKTNIALANKLLGGQGEVANLEEAKVVIAAEVARRAQS